MRARACVCVTHSALSLSVTLCWVTASPCPRYEWRAAFARVVCSEAHSAGASAVAAASISAGTEI